MTASKLISIVLPCRNEEQAVAHCLQEVERVIKTSNLNAEVIVSDSSQDKSPMIAREFGVNLVSHQKEGYGAAYFEGFKAAKGEYIFLADCDGTYDFAELPKFISYLDQGYDFVIGDRFLGNIEKGAMPWLHRYIGSPLLSLIFSFLFWKKIGDINCGMRALTKEALSSLKLRTTGMEFASEMVIKASRQNLKIKETPINYFRRQGKSKLRSFADGWRHLRFMLLYSPWFLFLVPGSILFLVGLILFLILLFQPAIWGLKFYYHPMFLASALVITGYQLIIFSVFAKTYAITHLGEQSVILGRLHKFLTIEKASLFGLGLGFLGLLIYGYIFYHWVKSGFGPLAQVQNSVIALTLIVFSLQTIFSSFMLSILGIKEE
ncbi:MAG: glycosyltransferase family 2 protein [Patescibacteria group bacterium]|jgi:glycosyltransferase involved in cell wall biosynthesis|nr:glycosyltransferase family 2 protein [Patescibacteria group bacterium]